MVFGLARSAVFSAVVSFRLAIPGYMDRTHLEGRAAIPCRASVHRDLFAIHVVARDDADVRIATLDPLGAGRKRGNSAVSFVAGGYFMVARMAGYKADIHGDDIRVGAGSLGDY